MTRSRASGINHSPGLDRTRTIRQPGESIAGPSTISQTTVVSTARTRRQSQTESSSPQKYISTPDPGISRAGSSPRRDKGKGKAVDMAGPTAQPAAAATSRRVLPARIRRAAGGGQDGIRDLEDMIVDWLDRFGYPSDSPPGKTKIVITSLPIDMVDPPVYTTGPAEVSEPVTVVPQAGPSTARAETGMEIIETPDWVMVKAGQDDQEEAREELSSRIQTSPVRRLRRLSANDEHDDTSDEHYIRLHKRYEALEKRQRKDEKDKLAFERYKMRTRIDLLRGMSTPAWSSVVWTVLAREDISGHWEKGKSKVKVEGIEWLRRRLVKEGEEVMKRYDQLLPVDPRKARLLDSRVSTPTPSAMSRSPSPPPVILPARVTALKDSSTTLQRRRSLPSRVAQGQSPRKRRRSEAAPAPALAPVRKIIRITRQSQAHTNDEGPSDSESEPLSDPPSEEETLPDENGEGGSLASEPREASSSFASGTSSTASEVAEVPRRQGTRASTRIITDRKPPARASARIRQSLDVQAPIGVIDSVPSSHTVSGTIPPVPMSIDDDFWSDDTSKQLDSESNDGPMTKVVDQVTLDEQLEMDRVEAAVVI